jgi:hypothetical protein
MVVARKNMETMIFCVKKQNIQRAKQFSDGTPKFYL